MERTKDEIRRIGVDLGKRVFHVTAADAKGGIVERKRLRRSGLQSYLPKLPAGCEAFFISDSNSPLRNASAGSSPASSSSLIRPFSFARLAVTSSSVWTHLTAPAKHGISQARIKQNLKVKSFVNAVMTQLWIAMCMYLLLSNLKFASRLAGASPKSCAFSNSICSSADLWTTSTAMGHSRSWTRRRQTRTPRQTKISYKCPLLL